MLSTIADILKDEFCYVYCNTCKYHNTEDDVCEDCHRKYMYWEISEEESMRIATKIISALEDM